MSILIKHLKMPPVGESRTFVIDGNGDVHINGSLGHQRLVDYAVELPPHGRLIDADKFAETLKEVSIRQGYDKLFSDNILSVGDVFDAIVADLKGEGLDKYKQAPTVIEAEGSET